MIELRNEEWLPVVGYEGFYEVSNLGNVRSLDRLLNGAVNKYFAPSKILKQSTISSGYRCVKLSKNGVSRTHLVHRLVANCFCANRQPGFIVNHIDENKFNNGFENLEWVSRYDNNIYSNKKELIGVRKNTKNRYRADIRIDGKKVFLGSFKSEGEAYNAYKQRISTITQSKYLK